MIGCAAGGANRRDSQFGPCLALISSQTRKAGGGPACKPVQQTAFGSPSRRAIGNGASSARTQRWQAVFAILASARTVKGPTASSISPGRDFSWFDSLSSPSQGRAGGLLETGRGGLFVGLSLVLLGRRGGSAWLFFCAGSFSGFCLASACGAGFLRFAGVPGAPDGHLGTPGTRATRPTHATRAFVGLRGGGGKREYEGPAQKARLFF